MSVPIFFFVIAISTCMARSEKMETIEIKAEDGVTIYGEVLNGQ